MDGETKKRHQLAPHKRDICPQIIGTSLFYRALYLQFIKVDLWVLIFINYSKIYQFDHIEVNEQEQLTKLHIKSWTNFMTIRIILTRFAVSTFCIFHFFLKVPKNPLEKVYCYSNHTKPLISITAWIPVQGGFGEVCPSATAVMKALIDVSNLIFLCMYGC